MQTIVRVDASTETEVMWPAPLGSFDLDVADLFLEGPELADPEGACVVYCCYR